jgi:SAM-dependent methyltransferase
MSTGHYPEYLHRQYANDEMLKVMQATHEQYSEPPVDFTEWVLDRVGLRGDERVLDVGAGSGTYHAALSARHPAINYTALDLSEGMIRELAAPRRVIADAAALPFPAASFDVVLANHMLYHLPKPENGLREIRRVLKPEGVLVAATNSAGTMPQLVELLRRGILLLSKPGTPLVQMPPPPHTRFSLENGAQQLARYFPAVVRFDLPGTLAFPQVEPALHYLNTWRAMREPQLPPGIKWDDLLLVVRDQITRIIKLFGVLSVEKLSGVLIATERGGFIAEYQRICEMHRPG